MIELYWAPQTRAARAVWALEEIGAPYRLRRIDVRDANAKADPAFRRASPLGKVPALVDGDTRVADSAAIGLYLADAYPAAGLAPAIGDPARGPYLYWTIYAVAAIEPAMAEKFGGWTPKRGQHGWGDFPAMIAALELQLGAQDWLVGERFSMADLLCGSTLDFLRRFGGMPPSDTLSAYVDRCIARPAYRRAKDIEAAEA